MEKIIYVNSKTNKVYRNEKAARFAWGTGEVKIDNYFYEEDFNGYIYHGSWGMVIKKK